MVGRRNDARGAAPPANLSQTSPRVFQLNVRENSIIQKDLLITNELRLRFGTARADLLVYVTVEESGRL